MTTPNQAYVSNSVEFGGLLVTLYRYLSGQSVAPTSMGVYILESANPATEAVTGDRPGVDGGDNGFWIVNGKTEGAATLQVATSATPTPINGDIFRVNQFYVDENGTGVDSYYVVENPQPTVSTTEYRKVTCTIREEKFPNAVLLAANLTQSSSS